MAFFGFSPSTPLAQEINNIIQQRYSSEPLYEKRDRIILQLNDEIIDALLTGLIEQLPETEKRTIAEKLAHTVKSTVHILLKQLLGKADNQTVNQSIDFMDKTEFKTSDGDLKIGLSLSPQFVETMLLYYDQILQQHTIDQHAFAQYYKHFADQIIQHFMIDFNHTLNLGLFKRKASDLAANAVIKAVDLAIDKLIPHLKQEELEIMAKYHRQFFFLTP